MGNCRIPTPLSDSLQWQHGKHSFTFGGQDVYVQFTLWTTTGIPRR